MMARTQPFTVLPVALLLVAASLSAASLSAGAQPPAPRHAPAAKSAAAGTSAKPAATSAMPIDDWASLGTIADQPVEQARKLNVKLTPDGVEEITVFGDRDRRDAKWRAELHDNAPSDSPSGLEAAQPLYAKGPQWSSPEEQRTMSGAKDALGACGALFGLITCPDK